MNFSFPVDFDGTDYLRRPWHQKLLIFLAVRTATSNVFISRFEGEACAEHFDLPAVLYCHLCLEADYLQGPGLEREPAILNISWSGRHNLVRKGVPELLEAVRILKDEGRTVRVYLAGHRGDGYGGLQDLIARLDLADQVELLGEISRADKIDLLRRCEIYAQPSHFEGFGLAMAEAMGSGACVVTCKVGAVEEVVGEAGIYVQPGSARDLALGLRKALEDAPLRSRLQGLARERARRMFSRDMKTEFMRGLLESAGIS
jgi:glycosyltransferase involved in cell wall biosynthesis